ncbi:MAG: hypothetical protein AAF999_10075 [Pseudomonadota bacterium]
MSEAFVELLFWIVVFLVLFFGFRKLQKRKEDRRTKSDDAGVASKDDTIE